MSREASGAAKNHLTISGQPPKNYLAQMSVQLRNPTLAFRQCRTGKPGVPQSLGLQRVAHGLAIEQQLQLCTIFTDALQQWQPTPVLLPGKFHGQRSLVGYSPWGRKESDTTGQLHFTSQQHAASNLPIYASFQSISWSSECLFLQINFIIASTKEKENSFQTLARIALVLQINLHSQSVFHYSSCLEMSLLSKSSSQIFWFSYFVMNISEVNS